MMFWRREAAVGLLLAVLAGSGCSLLFNRPWRGTEGFVESLRCGMSPENVKEQASRYRKLSLNETDEPEVWVAWRKETSIRLWFEDSRLQAHKVMWFYPITNSGARFKTNICTGQRFVDLQVLGPRESASAAVLLDGRKVGELSSAGSASFDVPLGNHRLTVEGPGMESQTFELRYDEMSSPRDALQVGPDNE